MSSKLALNLDILSNFRVGTLLNVVLASAISFILTMAAIIAYSKLIFQNAPEQYIMIGVQLSLISGVVLGVIMALTNSYRGTIAIPQMEAALVLSFMVSVIVNNQAMEGEQLMGTIMMLIALCTFSSGLCFFLLGKFNLGKISQFIPFPVIGGLMAGIGWLLVVSAFSTMLGKKIDAANIDSLISMPIHWLPGVCFAGLLFYLKTYRPKWFKIPAYYDLPMVLAMAIAGFWLVKEFSGFTEEALRNDGFLFNLGVGEQSTILLFEAVKITDWGLLFENSLELAGHFIVLLVISLFAVFFGANVLETRMKINIDPDQDLRSAGAANLSASLFAGLPGWRAVSHAFVVNSLGAEERLMGLISAALCALVFFADKSILGYLPNMVIGIILLFIGMDFLHKWLIVESKNMATLERMVQLSVLLAFVTLDIRYACLVGLVASVLYFTISYSRMDIIKFDIDGSEIHSRIDRREKYRELLRQYGDATYIIRLGGYVFFGTVYQLIDKIRQRCEDDTKLQLEHVIIDFKQIKHLDSSASMSFAKIARFCAEYHCSLVLTDVPKRYKESLPKQSEKNVWFDTDLDRGLERCEERIIRKNVKISLEKRKHYKEQLSTAFSKPEHLKLFLGKLSKRYFQAHDTIVKCGEHGKEIFILLEGEAEVELPGEDKNIRLKNLKPGAMFGEMAMYDAEERSATIKAKRKAVVYVLSHHTLEELCESEPQIAIEFHQYVAKTLAIRLNEMTKAFEHVTHYN